MSACDKCGLIFDVGSRFAETHKIWCPERQGLKRRHDDEGEDILSFKRLKKNVLIMMRNCLFDTFRV